MPPSVSTTDETDPGSGNRQAGDNVQYEFKSVQSLRGRENSAKAKWQDQGWEFISENRGTLRTELNFRRVKPKTFGAYLLSFVATFRRLQPKTQLALVASGALILVAGIIGIVAGTQSGGDTPNPSAAQATPSSAPPADAAVTDVTMDELVCHARHFFYGRNEGQGSVQGDCRTGSFRTLGDWGIWGLLCPVEDERGMGTSLSLSMSPPWLDGRTARRSRWS